MVSSGRAAASDQREAADGSVSSSAALVPSRRQYLDLKQQHPDAVLLYRMGDFYETFDEDAALVARTARITLTSRSFGRSGRVPMAGIPHHALNHYLARLLHAGLTIAIAEQLTPPGRGLVERAVTRVLTPGTIADPGLLPAGQNRYLASVSITPRAIGLAWVDVSTAEFALTEFHGDDARESLDAELVRLAPAEVLIPRDLQDPVGGWLTTRLEEWLFRPDRARDALLEHFQLRSTAPLGCEAFPAGIGAAGAIVAYLGRTNPSLLPLLTLLRTDGPERIVRLDPRTRRNLELTESFGTGGRRGSLLSVLDHTRTAMGTRKLRQLIGRPLRDLPEIRRRQGIVGALVEEPRARLTLGAELEVVGDLERLVGRAAQADSLRDLLGLRDALRSVPAIQARLRATGTTALMRTADELDSCVDLLRYLAEAVEADERGAPAIRTGFSPELDTVRRSASDTVNWIRELERTERERTGIKSLKVSSNKVFGFYIEVTRPNLRLVPADYQRKQTVANGERFITQALLEAEARSAVAEEAIAELERAAVCRIAERVQREVKRLITLADRLAFLDAVLALAEAAARGRWVRPQVDESEELEIVEGRHPVVEANLEGDPFIPNDCRLGYDSARLAVVTGPNMGGKSTYLRQVALAVLLAQIGSFVPARRARIGLVDRIFSRVGAHDDLAAGASTFMVEMIETATILRQATRKSLVILDEVGRGTSTADGRAIAQAVLEDLHDRVLARTLFATHYLELTPVAERLAGATNLHVASLAGEDEVVFLYSVRPGSAEQAYGVHVARLAGLPFWVAERAGELLEGDPGAEQHCEPPRPAENGTRAAETSPLYQLTLDGEALDVSAEARLAAGLRSLDLSQMSPLAALEWLTSQRQRLDSQPHPR